MLPLHITTPLIESYNLERQIQRRVYLKLECLQPSGSFKLRGIGALCQEELQKGVSTFVASSGGNAGIAVAYCGRKLGIPTTVFIPSSSSAIYINAIKAYGAEVVIAGSVWDEAHKAASEFALKYNAAYIPPFDHPTLWKGHATIIEEVANQGIEKPDLVILSVGGGGLACGVLQGMHQQGWEDVPLIAAETEGADAMAQSLRSNHMVTLDNITSKATSLGAKRIAQSLWDWTFRHEIKSLVVSDAVAASACSAFVKEQRILVELSCGAALSAVYENHPILGEARLILVIVCGGVNTYPQLHIDNGTWS